jgi:hypothetical protein
VGGGARTGGPDPTRVGGTPGAAVLSLLGALEAADAAGFAGLATAASPPPSGRELVVLAALIAPRVVLALCCGVVVVALVRARPWATVPAVVLLWVVAAQAALGMFLLDGVGQRPLLRGAVALTAAATGISLRRGAVAPVPPAAPGP